MNTNKSSLLKKIATYAACSAITTCAWNGVQQMQLESRVDEGKIGRIEVNAEALYEPIFGYHRDYPAAFDVDGDGVKDVVRVYQNKRGLEPLFYLPSSEAKKGMAPAFVKIPIVSDQYNPVRNAVGLVWLDVY